MNAGACAEKLSDEKQRELIVAVKNRPQVWCADHPLNRNWSDRAEIWKEIGEEINVGGEVAKVNWRRLRDTYKKTYKLPNCRFSEDLRFLVGNWTAKRANSAAPRAERLPVAKLRQLIAAVKSRRELWYHRHPSYNSKRTRVEMWKEVGRQIQVDGEVARWNWLRTRNNFSSERYKIEHKRTKSQEGSRFYRSLQFLNANRRAMAKYGVERTASDDEESVAEESVDEESIDKDYLFLASLVPSVKKFSEIGRMRLKLKLREAVYETLWLRSQRFWLKNQR